MSHAFPADERAAFYRVIETRRDIRAFRSDPIPEDVLMKILGAAHHAPSVGLMQPWNFIVIHDRATKARVHTLFLQENAAAASNYEGAPEGPDSAASAARDDARLHCVG